MDCRRRLRKIRLHSLSAAAGTEAPHSPNRPREGRGPCRLGVPFSKPRKEAISSLRFLGLCYLGLLLQILKKMWYLLMDILESVRRVCRQGTCVCVKVVRRPPVSILLSGIADISDPLKLANRESVTQGQPSPLDSSAIALIFHSLFLGILSY